jgi:hypothetical protein
MASAKLEFAAIFPSLLRFTNSLIDYSMKLSGDLENPWLIHAKGALFVVIGLTAAGLLFLEIPSLKTALLLTATIWAFCRFYYYLFYVLERNLGREKRFAGAFDALRYLWKSRSK